MAEGATASAEQKAGGGKRRLVLLGGAGLLVVAGGGAGAAFMLGLPPFGHAPVADAAPRPPVFVDVPEIVANLNAPARRPTFVRLRSKLEVGHQHVALVQASMPRLLDMFTTFLRETRPEELRGSAGAHRLREELVARANIATQAGAVSDVLFVELVIQ